jgi:predicted Rossmann fold flavoprotein
MSNIVVIGGGAAGMMAAIAASEQGHKVSLYEKNEKLGKKIYITGKGRCNLTNDCDVEELLQAVCTNRKFLYSSFYGFTSQDTIRFFEEQGMATKTERGNRVFPVSDHSSDVIAALSSKMRKNGVTVHLMEGVKELLFSDTEPRRVTGIRLESGKTVMADAVIVATGGFSYRTTGSTGDGYRFAREAGHTVTELSPSLVPMETAEGWAQQLQGLSLRNVEVTIADGKKELYRSFGEMMFTHFGVTGPLILTASTVVQKKLKDHPLQLMIDLKPALSEEQLDARILREFEAAKNKQLKNVLGALYPSKLIPVMIERSGIPGEKAIHDISKEERKTLLALTKRFPLTVTRLRDYNEAIITRGGVSVREINPATMESKLVGGLYFAGEVLDLDAVTGGFNLQIAWATGHLAGQVL